MLIIVMGGATIPVFTGFINEAALAPAKRLTLIKARSTKADTICGQSRSLEVFIDV